MYMLIIILYTDTSRQRTRGTEKATVNFITTNMIVFVVMTCSICVV